MRLLNTFSNETKDFVQEILNYSGDPTVTCYNPQTDGPWTLKIDTVFSTYQVDLTTCLNYPTEYAKLMNDLLLNVNVLTVCLNREIQNQSNLLNIPPPTDWLSEKVVLALIAASCLIVLALMPALWWVIRHECCYRKAKKPALATQEGIDESELE